MTTQSLTIIVGLGKTGLSCARFLARQNIPFLVMDSRAEPPGLAVLQQELPDVECVLGGFDAERLAEAGRIILSPGVPLRHAALAKALARGVPVLGDIELFARHARAPVIAITGANGKSTVTSLVGDMARHAGRDVRVGGNLGTPALDLLGKQEPELYVLELSSFQLETTSSLNAAAAVVLNISPDHMDRYADVEDYAAAKRRVYQGDGLMVVNKDDPTVLAMADASRTSVYFGFDEPAPGDFGLRDAGNTAWLAHGAELLIPFTELRIKGAHNVANALAALALGHAVGLPRASMLEALREFPGLPHRTEWVAEHRGVTWYNDSKGTNVGATRAAIQGLVTTAGGDARVVLIAGGDGKGADFLPLRNIVREHVRMLILIGRDAALIEAAVMGMVMAIYAVDMDDAVRQAARVAHHGDMVLLSPACASFDMYSGYEERGRVFTAAVHAYLASLPAKAEGSSA